MKDGICVAIGNYNPPAANVMHPREKADWEADLRNAGDEAKVLDFLEIESNELAALMALLGVSQDLLEATEAMLSRVYNAGLARGRALERERITRKLTE